MGNVQAKMALRANNGHEMLPAHVREYLTLAERYEDAVATVYGVATGADAVACAGGEDPEGDL